MAKLMMKILKGGGLYGNDPGNGPVTGDEYTLKVNNGSGAGTYSADQVVTIKADTPPSGQVFKKWIVVSGNPQINNIESSSTTLTMPSGNVEISAIYEDEPVSGDKYTLIVNKGYGDGSYSVNQTVTIAADPAPLDKVFDKWKVISGNPQINNIYSSSTTLKMPSENVEITVIYQDEPVSGDKYKLIVNDGSGDGSYSANKVLTITADEAPPGQVFDKWEVVSGNPQIDKIDSSSTTLKMPSGNVEISASYKDEEDIGCGSILDMFKNE